MDLVDFFRFLFRLDLSSSQMQRDLAILREKISVHKENLIPFSREEMELLSINQVDKKAKKGFHSFFTGVFLTIYYEQLIVYGIKSYGPSQSLILIASSSDEYVYLKKSNLTHVFVNNFEVGTLDNDGNLYNAKKQLIAKVLGDDTLPTHSVFIKGREIGYITNPKLADKNHPRAYQFLQEMDKDETYLFLCLTLINLVEEAQL